MSSRSSRFLPLFLLTAAVAPAANLTFIPSGDGASASLNEAASWSSGALPTATDGMLFTDPGTYTATATDSLSAGAFTQRNGNVTFALGGNTLSVLGDFSFNSTAGEGVRPSFTLRSGTIGAGRTYLGMGTGPVDVTLTGSGSVFRPGNGYIGYAAPDCTLSVLEGAAFAPTNTFGIGYLGTSSGNRMVVSGEGATHTIPRGFRFYAGENGSGNTVVYSDGASLLGESGSNFALGWNAAACCNTVLVHGASTTFLPQTVNVGNNGSSNLLEIAGGATVTINSLSVNARNGQGNRMLVRDASTLILTNGTTGVQNTGILTVSGEGTKMFLRQITVESGGRLEILDGAVSTNNSALAIGSNGRGGAEMIISNATHHSATIVNVGNYTSNCVLRVMDGATLSCPDSFLDIGSFNSASNNTAIIEGEGSSAVFSRFRIGGLSKDGIMIVRNGGTAYSGTYQLGSTAGCLRPRLEVLDGGVVTTRGNSASLVFGTANPGASNGVLRVRNGRVDFPLNNSSIALRNAGTIIIEGTNSTITVRDFWSAGSSVIEFNPPPLRCETPPAITVASALTFDDTVTLRVPAESAYRCAVGGGGTYTVFEHTTKDITDFFGALDLPEGVTAEVDGNRITVTIPNRAGTVFLVH